MMPIYSIENKVNKVVRIRRLTPYLSKRQLRFKAALPEPGGWSSSCGTFPMGTTTTAPMRWKWRSAWPAKSSGKRMKPVDEVLVV